MAGFATAPHHGHVLSFTTYEFQSSRLAGMLQDLQLTLSLSTGYPVMMHGLLLWPQLWQLHVAA